MKSIIFILSLLVLTISGCTIDTSGFTSTGQGQQQGSSSSVNQPGTTTYSNGFIKVYITDAPPQKKEITSIAVTISSVEVHLAVAVQDQEKNKSGSDNTTSSNNSTQIREQDRQQQQQGGSSWITISGNSTSTIDLLTVKGIESLFASSQVPAGKYTQVRLVVDTATVGFSDNTTQTATVPGGDLKFTKAFDVAKGETTALTFDFDADKMVTLTGSGKVMIKPVVKLNVKQK